MAHSLSPRFQNLFLETAGLDGVYVPFPVEPGRLDAALDGLWASGVRGLNVTVPHKEAALEAAAAIDDDARSIGAVNTLRRSEAGWEATNTDWQGLVQVLTGLGMERLEGRDVLLFGAGGTARAVVHAVVRMGGRRIHVANRNPGRRARFVSSMREAHPGVEIRELDWDERAVARIAAGCPVWIHATSIGLRESDAFPFRLPESEGLALDCVYRPDGRTPFVCASGFRRAVDGLPMLIAQGAASFAFWHEGMTPDTETALRRIERELGRAHAPLEGWRKAA